MYYYLAFVYFINIRLCVKTSFHFFCKVQIRSFIPSYLSGTKFLSPLKQAFNRVLFITSLHNALAATDYWLNFAK